MSDNVQSTTVDPLIAEINRLATDAAAHREAVYAVLEYLATERQLFIVQFAKDARHYVFHQDKEGNTTDLHQSVSFGECVDFALRWKGGA